jgi:hypothetical protein
LICRKWSRKAKNNELKYPFTGDHAKVGSSHGKGEDPRPQGGASR